MATSPKAGHVTGPLVENPVAPDPSGSPVPAVVLAYLTDEAAAAPALDGGGGGGGADDEPPEFERAHVATIGRRVLPSLRIKPRLLLLAAVPSIIVSVYDL